MPEQATVEDDVLEAVGAEDSADAIRKMLEKNNPGLTLDPGPEPEPEPEPGEPQTIIEDERTTKPPGKEGEEAEPAPAKPPEAESKPADGVEREDEEPLPKTNEDWARVRLANKEKLDAAQKAREAAEARVKELESGKPAAPEPEPEQQLPATRDVVQYLHQARRGDLPAEAGLDKEATNERVEKMAMQFLTERADAGELVDVLARAQKGEYGEQSDDIAEICQQVLPAANARDRTTDQAAAKKRADVEDFHQAYVKEAEQGAKHFPAFGKKDSPEDKFFKPWCEEFLGTLGEGGRITKKGLVPEDMALAVFQHPHVQLRLADMAFKASQYDAVVADRDKLQKRLAGSREPMGDEGEVPEAATSGAGGETADDILKQLKAANPGLETEP